MPSSNHAPRMMKGIIFSLVKNYRLQNSEEADYTNMCQKLFARHVARGWDRTTMKSWILEADRRLRLPPNPCTTLPTSGAHNRLFLHMEYHKNDIPKRLVRSIYERHCQPLFSKYLGVEQLTVAYSRAKNIKELASKAKLHQAPGSEASTFY